MYKSLKKMRLTPAVIIQISFLLIAFLYSIVPLLTPRMLPGDQVFNYLRLKEVSLDLLHGTWPQFSFYTGTILGNAVNSFYPWLTLVPLILLMYVLPPITWWYTSIGLIMLTGLEVTYFSSNTVWHNKKKSLLLSYFYCLSTIGFSIAYGQADINAFLAIMIFPSAFFGWEHWIKKGNWHMLAIGMLLLLFCHFPTFIITAGLLIVLTAFFVTSVNYQKLISGIKAVLCCILSGAIVWLPVIMLDVTNRIYLPSDGERVNIDKSQVPLIFKSLWEYARTVDMDIWDIIDLVSIILVILLWKKISSKNKRFAMVGLIILFLNIQPLALWLENDTPLKVLQFMHRISFFSHMLFSIILVNIIMTILPHVWKAKSIRKLLILIFGTMGMILLTGFIFEVALPTHKSLLHSRTFSEAHYDYKSRRIIPAVYTNHDLRSIKGLHYIPTTYSDYYPKCFIFKDSVMSRRTHKKASTILIRMPKVSTKNYRPNGSFTKHVNKARVYTLPITIYHQQKYNVSVNGHHVPAISKNHYLRVPMKPGQNTVSVHAPIMWYRALAMLLSVIGIIILCLSTIKRRHKYEKHSNI